MQAEFVLLIERMTNELESEKWQKDPKDLDIAILSGYMFSPD